MNDIELYRAIRRVADLWFEAVDEEAKAGSKIACDDRRGQSVNPFYYRTASGIAVEFYYGAPNEIWTPWGRWNFAGGTCSAGNAAGFASERFLRKIGQRVYKPLQRSSLMGDFGPVYEVLEVDGVTLPSLAMADQKESYDLYDVNNARWAELTEEYERG